jgi:hypothetical protein
MLSIESAINNDWQLGPIGMTNTVSLPTLPRSSVVTDKGNGIHLQPDVELKV